MAETKDKKKELPWSAYSEAEKKELEALSKGYIEFLTKCKTERESVREIIRQAQAAGYEDLEEIVFGESHQFAGKDHVSGGGDRQVLGKSFHNGNDDSL